MKATEMIVERRSVRKYKDELVSRETITEILEMCRWSPSWCNYQIARYTIIEDSELIARIAEEGVQGFAYNMGTLRNTKNLLVLSYVAGKSGKLSPADFATSKAESWEMFDAGIACQTFCLAAHSQGVGTCIFGVIDDKAIAEIVGLPENETVASIITFGYPDESPKPPRRFAVEEISRFL